MKIKKAVIPVAGKGTRFLPATKEIPKEMIPILDRPMIHYVVEEAVKSGIEQIVFVTSSGKSEIENYFDRNFDLENFLEKNKKFQELENVRNVAQMIEIITVRQKEQLGLGHAILCAKDVIGSDNFAVLLGDDLVVGNNPATKQLIEVSQKNSFSSVIGVMEIDKKHSGKYGIIDGKFCDNDKKTLKMHSMVEKPKPELAPSNLATPGRYVLSANIFDYLQRIERGVGGEYQLTDAINLLAKEQSVYAHIFEGERFDAGNIAGYLNATVEFALRSSDLKATMEGIIKDKIQKYQIK